MTSASEWTLTTRALSILAAQGVQVGAEGLLARFRDFHGICSTWNLAAKLMSRGDLERHFDAHIADSLSLASELQSHSSLQYVDIGSGGGFPAIPLALVFPNRNCVLIERSRTKASYLSQCAKLLPTSNINVVEGNFPLALGARDIGCIYTARAIEQPTKFDTLLFQHLQPGDVYLMQRAPAPSSLAKGLAAEPIEDEFSQAGLRRGTLYKIKR